MRLAPVLALVLLCVTVSAEPVHTSRKGTRVLPCPPEKDAFQFVIYGDRNGGPDEGIEILAQAVEDTNLLDPDLVMTVGDLVKGYNERPEWVAQMKEFTGVMSRLRMHWYPVAGNHDVNWRGGTSPPGQHEGDYEEHFGPLWYWFPHKNAAFVVLYSDEGDRKTNRKGWSNAKLNSMSPTQLAWLQGVMRETKDFDHVFLFLHHPRWISSRYKGTNWDAVHAVLKAAGNVSAVFAGHIHRRRYEGVRDGITYYALGTTGGGIPASMPGTGYLHHYDVVTVRKDSFHAVTIPVGQVLDPREMTPTRWVEVDRLRAVRPVPSGRGIVLRPDGGCDGEYRFKITNPAEHPIEITAEMDTKDRAWWFIPDHIHEQVPPGETREFGFGYRREAGDALEKLVAPGVLLTIEHLSETSRISLPPRRFTMPFGLGSVPSALLEPDARHALRIGGGRAGLRVSSGALSVPDGPMTVEGWLRADDLGGRRAFLSKTQQSEYGLFVSKGRPSFAIHINGEYVGAEARDVTLETGRWHHLAGVFDGSEVRLYVDGRLAAAKNGVGARGRNRLPFFVGADPDGRGRPGSAFDGLVDEVRVSKVARYTGKSFQPARRFAPDADTLLLLHLDRRIGPYFPDHSPGGRHATATGSVKIVSLK
jgi:Concanavalin A-like lectin/glucanases superfamily/Calcineurin-like phosphoesterase